MGLLGTLLLPAKLTLRALDDVHSLADGARALIAREAELRRAAGRIDAALDDVGALAEGSRVLRDHDDLRRAAGRIDAALGDVAALADGIRAIASHPDEARAIAQRAGAALDDLHSLADTARELRRHEDTLHALARVADARTAAILDIETRLVDALEPLVERVVALDELLRGVPRAIALVEHLEEPLGTVAAAIEALDRRLPAADDLVAHGAELRAAVLSIADVSRRFEHALPSGELADEISGLRESLDTVADTADALQPAAKRIGRVAERLPGRTS